LVLSRIIVFYPFFYAGYCIDKDKLLSKLSSKKYQLASLAIVTIYITIIFININDLYKFSPLLTGKNSYYTLGENFKVGWAARAVQYFIVFLISFCFISISTMLKKENITSKIGKNTLPIYALHYIPINFLFFKPLDPLIWMNKLFPLCPTLLIFPVAFIIVYMLSFDFWNIPFKFLKDKVTENTNNK
jgi:fucose 4-O-acetylase-like acetyltransferase